MAVAKRDLKVEEMLDGEGGYTVWGKLRASPDDLPVERTTNWLAHKMVLVPVARGQIVTWEDVAIDQQDDAIAFRREMEQALDFGIEVDSDYDLEGAKKFNKLTKISVC